MDFSEAQLKHLHVNVLSLSVLLLTLFISLTFLLSPLSSLLPSSCLSWVSGGFLTGKHIKAFRCVVEIEWLIAPHVDRHAHICTQTHVCGKTQLAFSTCWGRCFDTIYNSCSCWIQRLQMLNHLYACLNLHYIYIWYHFVHHLKLIVFGYYPKQNN